MDQRQQRMMDGLGSLHADPWTLGAGGHLAIDKVVTVIVKRIIGCIIFVVVVEMVCNMRSRVQS